MDANYPILTAREFIAQGTTAGAIMSIADTLATPTADRPPLKALAKRVRQVAREVADITGQSLQVPGAVTDARFIARRKAHKSSANDNRRSGRGAYDRQHFARRAA